MWTIGPCLRSLVVYDKYWDMDTLQYNPTAIISVIEHKRLCHRYLGCWRYLFVAKPIKTMDLLHE
jgi:hypothetical protein